MKEKTKKKNLGSIIAVIVVVTIVSIVGVEVSKRPELISDIKNSANTFLKEDSLESRATIEEYNNVKIGMSMDDVKKVLGDNIMLSRTGKDEYMFVIKYNDGREDTATLIFDNDDSLVQKNLFSEQRKAE